MCGYMNNVLPSIISLFISLPPGSSLLGRKSPCFGVLVAAHAIAANRSAVVTALVVDQRAVFSFRGSGSVLFAGGAGIGFGSKAHYS